MAGDDPNADLQARTRSLAPVDRRQDTALVIVQYPDFFGRVFDYTKLIEAAHAQGALVCVVANPTALAMFKTPGAMGADIVVGEGQPLGHPDVVRRPSRWAFSPPARTSSTKWRDAWSVRRSTRAANEPTC